MSEVQGSPSKKYKSAVVSETDYEEALFAGNVEEVRRVLGIDCSLVNQYACCDLYPPIYYAISRHLDTARSVVELVDFLQVLLDHKADVNAKEVLHGYTALHIAVGANLLQVVQLLLQNNANVEVTDDKGLTPLMVVASAEMARLLIAHGGADVNGRNSDGYTPVVFAQTPEIAELLMAQGADVNGKNNEGYPAWFAAIGHCHDVEAFKLLMEQAQQGVDLHSTFGQDALSCIHKICDYNPYAEYFTGEDLELMEYLLDQGLDVNARTASGKTPLHFAVCNDNSSNRAPLVQLLVQRGADVHATDNTGETPFASVFSYADAAKLLIDHGADLTTDGKKALIRAVEEIGKLDAAVVRLVLEQGQCDLYASDSPDKDAVAFFMLENLAGTCRQDESRSILMLLIQHAPDVNTRSRQSGRTLLHFACDACVSEGRELVAEVELLLEKGSHVNVADNEGFTPLLGASKYSKWTIVKLLVNHGADVNVALKSDERSTPLSIACERDLVPMVQLLLTAGAQVDYRVKDGVTSLLICVQKGFIRCATFLLERGADIHAEDRNGNTPFLLACQIGELDMIYILIRLCPHHRRLGLLSQVANPLAFTVADK